MTAPEDALRTDLRDAADGFRGEGSTLAEVLDRAHVVRRRRRIATGIAVAALVALVAPGSLWAADQLRADRGTVDPAEDPTRLVDPAPVATTGYLDPETGTVHHSDGSTARLALPDGVSVNAYTRLSDGRTVVTGISLPHDGPGNPPASAYVFDDSGELTAEYPDTKGFETADVTQGRDAVGWLAPDGTPTVVVGEVEEPVALPRMREFDSADEVALIGLTCGPGREEGADFGCSAVAGPGAFGGGPAYVSASHGFTDLHPEERVLAVAPDNVRFLAPTKVADVETCVGVMQVEDGRTDVRGEDCFPGALGPSYAFSPDGSWVVAHHGEGYGPASTAILDGRTLEQVAVAADRSRAATYHQAVWGDGYVDMLVEHGPRGMEEDAYELQRLHLDGTVETLRETGWIVLETR